MKLSSEIETIMSKLPKSESDFFIDGEHHIFSSGDYYIQHIPSIIDEAQREFLFICWRVTGVEAFLNQASRQGIAGRVLDDFGNNLLSNTWNRFMCIDNEYREWGQPYFAIVSNGPITKESPTVQRDRNFQYAMNIRLLQSKPLNLLLPELRDYFLTHERDKKIKTIVDNE